MSEKNPVSNFISADDEMLSFLLNLGQKWHKSDDVANFIERNFTFVGSKPLLQNLIKLSLQILKLSFTRKNWLLKFGFAYRLAQILEPKLLVHEILKFVWVFKRI